MFILNVEALKAAPCLIKVGDHESAQALFVAVMDTQSEVHTYLIGAADEAHACQLLDEFLKNEEREYQREGFELLQKAVAAGKYRPEYWRHMGVKTVLVTSEEGERTFTMPEPDWTFDQWYALYTADRTWSNNAPDQIFQIATRS